MGEGGNSPAVGREAGRPGRGGPGPGACEAPPPANPRALSWMEACLKEELPSPVELEDSLRNGVLLARLGHCFAPSVVPLRKIYDVQQLRYQVGPRAPSAAAFRAHCPFPKPQAWGDSPPIVRTWTFRGRRASP